MASTPLLLSTGTIVGIVLVAALVVIMVLLLRNRARCPKDGASMELVAPKTGHHMVFKCPKCGHQRRTRVPLGRR